jgi:hypothetical protein
MSLGAQSERDRAADRVGVTNQDQNTVWACHVLNVRYGNKIKMAVFWTVTSCSLVDVYRRFRGAYKAIALMMEAESTSEMSVNFYQTTRRNNPKDSHLNICEHFFLINHT